MVRGVEILVDLEWSVLFRFWLTREWSVVVCIPHDVDLDPRGRRCIRVYTGVCDLPNLLDLHVLHDLHVLP